MASIPEARASFNLKVLRRHDASIVEIFETASFVVLYNYNGGEWTKTGVEGPLFLFRRRLPPYNGFFLMNRNGVENFSADVTPDDDLEITPEFIIYRPVTNGDNEVYGIWVFEPNQRMAVGDKLLKLQQMMDAPSDDQVNAAQRASSTVAPEAGGDAKEEKKQMQETGKGGKQKANGKPKKGSAKHPAAPDKNAEVATKEATPHESAVEAFPETESSTQINLDDLFGNSASASEPAPTQPPSKPTEPSTESQAGQPASNGPSLIDSLFQSAVTIDTSTEAAPPPVTPASAETTNTTKEDHSQDLLSLLGGSNQPKDRTDSANANAQPTKPEHVQKPAPWSETPKMSELIERGIRDRVGLGDDGKPLSRREFVTELLSMVHVSVYPLHRFKSEREGSANSLTHSCLLSTTPIITDKSRVRQRAVHVLCRTRLVVAPVASLD